MRVVQINLHHIKLAMAVIGKVLIGKPWTCRGKVGDLREVDCKLI